VKKNKKRSIGGRDPQRHYGRGCGEFDHSFGHAPVRRNNPLHDPLAVIHHFQVGVEVVFTMQFRSALGNNLVRQGETISLVEIMRHVMNVSAKALDRIETRAVQYAAKTLENLRRTAIIQYATAKEIEPGRVSVQRSEVRIRPIPMSYQKACEKKLCGIVTSRKRKL